MNFEEAYKAAKPYAVVDQERLAVIYGQMICTNDLPGELAEVGVYRGGSAKAICLLANGAPVHLFDTFEGIPDTADPSVDYHTEGDFPATLESVQQALSDCPNAIFHKGLFPETAKGLEDKWFRFVNLDGDIYQTTKDGLEFFWPRMVPGGVIVFDDMLWPRCPGVAKAVFEFYREHDDVPVPLSGAHFQCYIVKPGKI